MQTATNTNVTEITNLIGAFMDFEGMAMEYIAKRNADEDASYALQEMCVMNKMEKVSFMAYLLEYWNAYTMDIINGNYCYIKFSSIVYQAWEDYSTDNNNMVM